MHNQKTLLILTINQMESQLIANKWQDIPPEL